MKALISTFSALILVISLSAQTPLNGTYSLGVATSDFLTFNEAVTALNNFGVNGPVVFDVQPGIYYENIILTNIQGTSGINTITFQSGTGVNTDVEIFPDGSQNPNQWGILSLDGAEFIIIKNMSFFASGSYISSAIDLYGGSNNILIDGNIIRSVIKYQHNGIINRNGTVENFITIRNNDIQDCVNGVSFSGSMYNSESGNIIENNRIISFNNYGIYMEYQDTVIIQNNIVKNIGLNNTADGMKFRDSKKVEVKYNTIIIETNNISYGIYFRTSSGNLNDPNIVSNNYISIWGNGSKAYCVNLYLSDNFKAQYNTFNILNSSFSNNSYCFATNSNNLELRNNIFSNNSDGYTLFNNSSSTLQSSDFNCFYSNGANLIKWGGDFSYLMDWQSSSNMDLSSLSVDPGFNSNTDPHINHPALNGAANPIQGLIYDIDGDLRDSISPDIGADEFNLIQIDAGISEFIEPVNLCSGSKSEIKVKLKNYGADTLFTSTIKWTVNGIIQDSVIWNDTLLFLEETLVFIDSVLFAPVTDYNFIFWSEMPNNLPDQNNGNDTTTANNVKAAISSSTYSIGNTNADFQTISDAVDYLMTYGICGPVVFNVQAGIYNEQIELPEIPGVSDQNTIIFKSETGVNTDVTITHFADTDSNNFVLALNGADHISFKNMTFKAIGNDYANVIVLMNEANNNNVVGNIIESTIMNIPSNPICVLSDPSSLNSHNTFTNNQITGGNYGLSLKGTGDYISNGSEIRNIIEGNTISGFSQRAIDLIYQDTLIISKNYIENESSNLECGIWASYCNHLALNKNKIILMTAQRGIRLNACNGDINSPTIISNNFIHISGCCGIDGIILNKCEYTDVFYNSVNISNSDSISSCFEIQGNGLVNVYNNIFSNYSRGIAYYLNSPFSLASSDNNNFYTNGTILGMWFQDTLYTLQDLQNISGLDTNSISIFPNFVSDTNLYIANLAMNGFGIPIPSIQDDIDSNPRDPVSPAIGAHEFNTIPFDAGLTKILQPKDTLNEGDIVPVKVIITNNGTNSISNFDIVYEVNNGSPVTYNYSNTLLPSVFDTVLLPNVTIAIGESILCALVICPGDSNNFNDKQYISYYGNPIYNPSLTKIVKMNEGCGLGIDTIKVWIRNDGIATLNSGLTASYQIGNVSNLITENVTSTISPGDSILFSFITLIDFSVTTKDSLFKIKSWVDHPGNVFHEFDSAELYITSLRPPLTPIVSDTNIPYGTEITLEVISQDSIVWYDSQSGTTVIGTGNFFTTPHLFDTTIYWVEPVEILPSLKITEITQYNTGIGATSPYPSWMNGNLGFDGLEITNMGSIPADLSGYTVNVYEDELKTWEFPDGLVLQPREICVLDIASTLGGDTAHNLYVLGGLLSASSGDQVCYYLKDNGDRVIDAVATNGATFPTITGVTSSYWTGNVPSSSGNAGIVRVVSDNNTASDWVNSDVEQQTIGSENPSLVGVVTQTLGCQGSRVPLKVNPVVLYPNDVLLNSILSPPLVINTGIQIPIEISIQNVGYDVLSNVTIEWELDSLSMPSHHWNGNLPFDSISAPIHLWSSIFTCGNHTLKVWCSNPNGSIDPNNLNDTIYYQFYTCVSGNFSVGTQNSDFQTLTEVQDFLNNEVICGPVVFNIEPGIYNEQLELDEIQGVSHINTITFQSANNDSTSVIIQNSAFTDSTNWTIKLNGSDHVKFKQLTVQATGDYATAVVLTNGASYNELSGNIIKCNKKIVRVSFGISDEDTLNSNNSYINNRLLNPFHGIRINSDNSIIKGNEIINFIGDGILAKYSDSTKFISNEILSPVETPRRIHYIIGNIDKNGIFIRLSKNNQVQNNNIQLQRGFAGIYLWECSGSPLSPIYISNNSISVFDNVDYYKNGIVIQYSDYINTVYNSVSIIGKYNSNFNSYAFLEESNYGGNLVIKNNIFSNEADEHIMRIGSYPNASIDCDYNDIYTIIPSKIEYGLNTTDLNTYKATTGFDSHSITVDPQFISYYDLHTSSYDIDSAAIPDPLINTDIDGNYRDASSPDLGAYEFDIQQYDAGVCAINEPSTNINSGMNNIVVSIRNYGWNTLKSLMINWSINDILQQPYYWAGSINGGNQLDSVLVGKYNFNYGIKDIKIWSEYPNNNLDTNVLNDSTSKVVVVCSGPLNGIYYIGGTGSNYSKINDAIAALINCGISGPVTFNINPGVYYEMLYIPAISGTSITNTVTFQSSNADSTSVIIFNDLIKPNDNYTIKLDNADFIHFKWLNIKMSSIHQYDYVITTENGGNHNVFQNNIIDCQKLNGYSRSTGIGNGLNYGNNFTHNLIKQNLISQCDIGIDWNFNDADTTENNIIENNILTEFSTAGILTRNLDAIKIRSNHLENYDFPGTYAIQIYECNKNIEVVKNKIITECKYGNYSYGIEIKYSEGDSNNYGLIANNFISISRPSHDQNGIRLVNVNYHNYYYNSIDLSKSLNNSKGKPFSYSSPSTPSKSINIANNIFINNYGSSYSVSSTFHINISDNNDLLCSGPILATWNGSHPNLQSLQAASGKDLNSVSVDPGFVSDTDLHLGTSTLNGMGSPLASVTDDIDGDPRDPNTPDIGADESTGYNLDAGLISLLQPDIKLDSVGALNAIEVVIKNFGFDTITGFNVAYEIPGSSIVIETYTDTLFPMQTDTFLFSNMFTTIPGQYLIKIYSDLVGDQDHINDTISLSFAGISTIQGPVFYDFVTKLSQWIAPGNNNQWELGSPTANTINTAHSGSNAWATILDSSYFNLRTDYLYTPFLNMSQMFSKVMKFWHWVCTEKYYDGGYIEYLNNNGDWILLGTKDDPYATNWYNTFAANKYLWSGHSNGWIYSTYDLNYLTDLGNITQFRFVFTSNISTSDDGWAIDDFEFGFPYEPLDVGVNMIITPVDTTLPGSNVQVSTEIINYGIDTIYSMPVSYKVNGSTPVTEIWNGILQPYANTYFTFLTHFVPPVSSSYIISSYTELSNDAYLLNDTIQKEVINNANYIVEDIGIEEIIFPIDTTIIGVSVPVEVIIRNLGTKSVYSTPIFYSIDGGLPVIESWIGSLAPNDIDTFTFITKYKPPTSSLYEICAYTGLINDFDNNNDSSCKNMTNAYALLIKDVGITSLISPVDTTVFGIPVQVRIEIKNFGTDTLISLPVYYSIDGGPPYSDIWYGYLLPSTSDIFMFSTQYNPPNDTIYEICTYCDLGNDVDNSNDTICKTLINKITTGIESFEEIEFWLGQNIPNPTTNTTRIFYSIPNSGKIAFRIVNLYGQIVYSSNQEHVQGTNMIELDVSQFKPGIYYYSIYYKGKRLTKKMVISK